MRHVEQYREHGFAVVRGVFDSADMAALSAAFDEVKAKGAVHPRTFRHGNVLYAVTDDTRLGPTLRFVQWASYFNAVAARYRIDRRMFRLIEPLLGRDLKQITNTMIWKTPGAAESGFAYHQDFRFRRPASAFRKLDVSIVQTAIAIDPHRPDNGAMRMCAGSHRRGDLHLGVTQSVYGSRCEETDLEAVGIDRAALVDIVLEPGDVTLWHPYTVHGSPPNASPADRRSYVNAYLAAAECDRGEWAFRDGHPCELGEPVLVQYDDLYQRPEPHYVDGAPHPFTAEPR